MLMYNILLHLQIASQYLIDHCQMSFYRTGIQDIQILSPELLHVVELFACILLSLSTCPTKFYKRFVFVEVFRTEFFSKKY